MCNLDETNENIRKRSIVYRCEHLFNNFRQDYANKLKICIVAKGLATRHLVTGEKRFWTALKRPSFEGEFGHTSLAGSHKIRTVD